MSGDYSKVLNMQCAMYSHSGQQRVMIITAWILAVMLQVTVATTADEADRKLRESWEAYKIKFWKELPHKETVRPGHRATVQTMAEERLRFSLFERAVNEISKHNSRFARGEVTSTLGINKFTAWTEEEKESLLGLRIPKLVSSRMPDGKVVGSLKHGAIRNGRNVSMPDHFDWRAKGVVTRVKNQAGAIEGQLLLERRKIYNDSATAMEDHSLSTQQLVDCGASSNGTGCSEGDWPMAVLERMTNKGIVKDSDYPNTHDKGRCKTEIADKHAVVKLLGGSYVQPRGSDDALVQAVADVDPIFRGGGCFQMVFTLWSKVDHAVLVVGFGRDNATNERYWIIKNSWGPEWGEDGLLRMYMNNNSCGVSTYAVYPIIALV